MVSCPSPFLNQRPQRAARGGLGSIISAPVAAHWPLQGDNKLEVKLIERDAALTPPIALRDVELETKYMMGKNFHRGQDPDLGPARGGSPD